jgi:hypothetical protein
MEPNAVFRPRKACLIWGILGVIVFISFLAMSVYLGVNDGSVFLGFLFGAFWGFWIVCSVWTVLKYFRDSLAIQNGTIVYRGVRSHKSLTFSDLVEVRWKRTGFGVIVLLSKSDKVKVCLDNFTPEQRLRIISWLRKSAPQSIQQRWEPFCFAVAMPLLRRLGKYTPQEPGKFCLLGLPAWGMIGITGVIWFQVIKLTLPYPAVWAWTGMIVWFGVLLFDVYRAERRIRCPRPEDAERVLRDWERYESSQ